MLYIGLGSAAVAIVEIGPKLHGFVEVTLWDELDDEEDDVEEENTAGRAPRIKSMDRTAIVADLNPR
jgi:hypothetical protein